MTLQEEQEQLDTAIWQGILAVLPEEWESGTLTVSADSGIDDGLGHSIGNPDGVQGVCFPSDELYLLTQKHFDLFKIKAKPWREVTWTVRYDFDEENWKCAADIDY